MARLSAGPVHVRPVLRAGPGRRRADPDRGRRPRAGLGDGARLRGHGRLVAGGRAASTSQPAALAGAVAALSNIFAALAGVGPVNAVGAKLIDLSVAAQEPVAAVGIAHEPIGQLAFQQLSLAEPASDSGTSSFSASVAKAMALEDESSH